MYQDFIEEKHTFIIQYADTEEISNNYFQVFKSFSLFLNRRIPILLIGHTLKDDWYLLILLLIALTWNIKLHIYHVTSTAAYSVYGYGVYVSIARAVFKGIF